MAHINAHDHALSAMPRREPIFIPPEIVDHVLSDVAMEFWDRETLSSCALVSQGWLDIARRHRYNELEFTLDTPLKEGEYTLFELLSGEADAPGPKPERKPEIPLLEALQQFPAICPHVHGLKLRVAWEMDPSDPEEKLYFSFSWLQDVLTRLPNLKRLRLPPALSDWEQLATMSLPLTPRLEILDIPPLLAVFSGTVLLGILSLFGHVSLLMLDMVHIRDPNDDDAAQFDDAVDNGENVENVENAGNAGSAVDEPVIIPLPLPNTVLQSVIVSVNALTCAPLMDTFIRLPSANLLTSLDLTFVLPEDISLLAKLISTCSPSLERLSLDLEHVEPSYDHALSPSHYLTLDLSQCPKLHSMSLRIHFYIREGAKRKALTPKDYKVSAYVVDFLRKFVAKPIPAMMRLSLKNYRSDNMFNVPLTDIGKIDEILVRYHLAEGTRIGIIQGWHNKETSSDKHHSLLRRLYPKLHSGGLLEFHV